MTRFDGRTAVVTGGASGIGKATVERLVSEGAQVLIADVDEVAGNALAVKLGDQTAFNRHDVTREDDWQSSVAVCLEKFGSFDILVNNAGIVFRDGQQTPEDLTVDEWHIVTRVNMDGVMLGCRQAINAMKSGGGSIVNLASVGAQFASPIAVPYGAAKAAVVQLTKTIAIYCAKQGYDIRCNAVLPGPIETALYSTFTDEQRAANARSVPIGRVGKAQEIAAAIAFLASDDASYITGTQLIADGGLSAANPMRAAD